MSTLDCSSKRVRHCILLYTLYFCSEAETQTDAQAETHHVDESSVSIPILTLSPGSIYFLLKLLFNVINLCMVSKRVIIGKTNENIINHFFSF